MSKVKQTLKSYAIALGLGASCFVGLPTPAVATEPAQDENLAFAIGVQTYSSGFPMMDLYRTLWERSFDPGRGHDRTLNQYFVFDRLITSEDDWDITPNNATIYLRAFLDLRAEPILNRSAVGDRTKGMVYGTDGSLEIFLQAEGPTDPQERANWLPAPQARFYLLIRHYSPQAAILTGDWTPPAVNAR